MEGNTINDISKEVALKSQLEILIRLIMKANLRRNQKSHGKNNVYGNSNNGHLAH